MSKNYHRSDRKSIALVVNCPPLEEIQHAHENKEPVPFFVEGEGGGKIYLIIDKMDNHAPGHWNFSGVLPTQKPSSKTPEKFLVNVSITARRGSIEGNLSFIRAAEWGECVR